MKKIGMFATVCAVAICTASSLSAAAIQTHKLTAGVDASENAIFGTGVAVSGGTAIVSARLGDGAVTDSGTAYLFDVATGVQGFELTASDGAAADFFGASAAISGNYAIVGAYQADPDLGGGPLTTAGAAYVYDVSTGAQLWKLTASDAANGDAFGFSVAISGNYAVVGSRLDDDADSKSGSAYLFDVTTGTQLAKFVASDATGGDEFGWSVGISGNTAIVGAWRADGGGAAYTYDFTTDGTEIGTTATETNKLTGATGRFGVAVAIDGNIAAVGEYLDDENSLSNSGSAYLFNATDGTELVKLTAGLDAGAADEFGRSIAISGNTLVVGASDNDDAGADSGSAYLFDATTFAELDKLTASDADAGDLFGLAVGIDGTDIIVGGRTNDDVASNAGSAYLFSAVPEPSSIALIVCGMIGLTFSSRRRKA